MNQNELYHHGILGQKWGQRRYQNSDGTLTPEGRKRYGRAVARKDYKINRLQRRQEKTNSFNEYRNLDKRIRKVKTRRDRKKQGLTQKDIETGRKQVARFRLGAATVGTIAKASGTMIGSVWVLSHPGIALLTPAVAVVGGVITSDSAKKIPYYFEETRRFSKGNPKAL